MYTFSSTVRYSECDEHGYLGIVPLINYLQDCSCFQTENLGFKIDFNGESHFAWLLAAWQIVIDRLPHFNEQIDVSTWCYDMRRTYALRNFQISGEDGMPCVRADAIWFTFDTDNMRPIRIPASEDVYLDNKPRLDMPPTKRKLTVEGPYTEGEPIVVTEQHLDTNHHVNNAQYVLMALSAIGHEVAPSRICVQYQQQARLGDTIFPRIHEHESTWIVELVDADGEAYAIVQLEA